ncbi:MAG: translocation/assembly module TamB domain-containing protein [Pseudomonadota bacterium]
MAVLLVMWADRLISMPGVQERLRTTLSTSLGEAITWEGMTVSLLDGILDVTGFAMGEPGSETRIHLNHFRADLAWKPLIKGTLCIESLALDHPAVEVTLPLTGSKSVAGAPDSGEETAVPWTLPFRSLDVRDVRIQAGSLGLTLPDGTNAARPGRIDIQGISLQGSGTGEPSARMSLEIQGGSIVLPDFQTRILESRVSGVLSGNRLESLSLSFHSDAVDIIGTGQVQDLFSSMIMDLELGISGRAAAINALAGGVVHASTDVKANVRIKGGAGRPEILAEVDTGKLEAAGFQSDNLHAESRISVGPSGENPETLAVSMDLDLNARGGRGPGIKPEDVSFSGRLDFKNGLLTLTRSALGIQGSVLKLGGVCDLESGRVSARLDLDVPEVRDLALRQEIRNVSGSLTLGADLTGSFSSPVIAMTVKAGHVRFQDIEVGDVTGAASLDQSGRLTLSSLVVRNLESDVRLAGHVDLFKPDMTLSEDLNSDLRIEFINLTPDNFYPLPELSGIIAGTLVCRGSLFNPGISLVARGKGIVVQGSQVPALDLDLNLDAAWDGHDTHITVNKGNVRKNRSDLAVTGTLAWPGTLASFDTGTCDVDLLLLGQDMTLGDFFSDVTGSIDLSGKIQGRLMDPVGSVHLTGKRLKAGEQSLDGFKADLRLGSQTVFLDTLDLVVSQGNTLSGTGWFLPGQGRYSLHLVSRDMALTGLIPGGGDAFKGVNLSMDIMSQGALDSPVASGSVVLTGLALWDAFSTNKLRFDLDFKDRLLKVSGPQDLPVKARLDTRTLDFSAGMDIEKVDVSALFNRSSDQGLTGMVSGNVRVSGNGNDPGSVSATLNIRELDVEHQGRPVIGTLNSRIVYENGIVTIPGLDLTFLGRDTLTLKGKVVPNGALEVVVKGIVPMDAVASMAGAVDAARGNLVVDARISGTQAKPDIKVDFRVSDVGVTLPEILEPINDVNGTIRITPDSIVIDSLTGRIGDGDIRVSGAARISGLDLNSTDIRIILSHIPIRIPDTADTRFDASLGFSGKPGNFRLGGDITLVEGTYYRTIKIQQMLGEITQRNSSSGPGLQAADNSFLEGIALDIRFGYKSLFKVDNNLAILLLRPDLTMSGTLANPLVNGRAQVVSGSVFFRKNEFEVIKGVVDFVNPYRIEPVIDIQSRTVIRDWTIILTISGPPDALKFSLKSSPAEEDGDILSLITTGKTTRELVHGGGGMTSSPTKMLADLVTDRISGTLKSSTGLDELKLNYTEGSGSAPPAVDVTLGKELSERLAVKYGVGTKDGVTVQKATADYKFVENLLIRSYQDTAGDYGGELIFRMEFR